MKKKVLKFKSKVDWLVAIVYFVIAIACVANWLIPYHGSIWLNITATITLGIIAIIFTWAVFSTYYLLTDEYVIAVSGPFRMRVFYDKIQEIKPSKNFWSSFALSFDRVALICGKSMFEKYYFSPKNKELFMEELKKRVIDIKK